MKITSEFNLACLLFVSLFLGACTLLGSNSAYVNDPLTGGIDSNASALLDISLPRGLQCFPSHGNIKTDARGQKYGLEVVRGHIDAKAAARNFNTTLIAAGWQLKTALSKGDKSFYLYQKDDAFIALSFYPQGMLTIIDIWKGTGDTANLDHGSFQEEDNPDISIAPEEYGPISGSKPETAEQWGPGSLEEKDL